GRNLVALIRCPSIGAPPPMTTSQPRGFGGFMIRSAGSALGAKMRGQAGFFDIDERLKQLSAKGDNLERLSAVVNSELFRADLEGRGRARTVRKVAGRRSIMC